MRPRAIAKIALDPSGVLFVCPQVEGPRGYEYIYREANGLRWDRERRALVAYEPARWEHTELLQHMVATLRSSFGEELCITKQTEWIGVSSKLKAALLQSITKG